MASSAIHMSRLGGRVFNHSASQDIEAEYDRLRDLARAEGDKKKSCFDRAHEAYERGDGAQAKELSDEGKRHQKKQAEYNKQASELIFRENNAPGRVAEDTIDLHGQFVEEAEDILEERIRYAQSTGQSHLHVIVGKGNHSTGHVQKLKPRVERLCQELGLDYATEENEGRMYVDLRGGRVEAPPPLPAQPPGYQGGYGGGGGGHHQQHHQHHHADSGGEYGQRPPQQQHQRPPPQQREEDIFSCLKSCCLVM
ncbi:DUF1771-domain-containing protein [Parathielavia appendiculata]|uniref:DUF1771-domain-containing protein n=1 Tax=Parathielavia appendiculata TaxID=2587402 RepID=A0AAN6TZ58_9PEZI|nr:DUF1771-domain-containing protein [Parathielavia appendiculata]